jgi:hypothetical protein
MVEILVEVLLIIQLLVQEVQEVLIREVSQPGMFLLLEAMVEQG